MRVILLLLLISLANLGFSQATLRFTCPKTRTCHQNKDCQIYGFKHNCHALCQEMILTAKLGEQGKHCDSQCLCIKNKKI